VCGAAPLAAHLKVRSGADPSDLAPTTDRYGAALSDIARCPACGHMQLAQMPAEETLSEGYAEAASEEYIEEEAGQRASACRALDAVERHVERGAILDLGCWVGFLLAEARERGWSTLGVEPSVFAARFARERLGLDVRVSELLECELPPASFDTVVLGDVIEHLIDPSAALDRIRELLRPGGVVYLALPDAGSRLARAMGAHWWSVLPTHVHYFTRGSIRRLLERRGFEVVELTTAPKAFTVHYYLDRVRGYSPRVAHGLVRAASAAGLADRLWAPDFRDRMAVVARRPADP
jgi:SAM-dependent methyltransferase